MITKNAWSASGWPGEAPPIELMARSLTPAAGPLLAYGVLLREWQVQQLAAYREAILSVWATAITQPTMVTATPAIYAAWLEGVRTGQLIPIQRTLTDLLPELTTAPQKSLSIPLAAQTLASHWPELIESVRTVLPKSHQGLVAEWLLPIEYWLRTVVLRELVLAERDSLVATIVASSWFPKSTTATAEDANADAKLNWSALRGEVYEFLGVWAESLPTVQPLLGFSWSLTIRLANWWLQQSTQLGVWLQTGGVPLDRWLQENWMDVGGELHWAWQHTSGSWAPLLPHLADAQRLWQDLLPLIDRVCFVSEKMSDASVALPAASAAAVGTIGSIYRLRQLLRSSLRTCLIGAWYRFGQDSLSEYEIRFPSITYLNLWEEQQPLSDWQLNATTDRLFSLGREVFSLLAIKEPTQTEAAFSIQIVEYMNHQWQDWQAAWERANRVAQAYEMLSNQLDEIDFDKAVEKDTLSAVSIETDSEPFNAMTMGARAQETRRCLVGPFALGALRQTTTTNQDGLASEWLWLWRHYWSHWPANEHERWMQVVRRFSAASPTEGTTASGPSEELDGIQTWQGYCLQYGSTWQTIAGLEASVQELADLWGPTFPWHWWEDWRRLGWPLRSWEISDLSVLSTAESQVTRERLIVWQWWRQCHERAPVAQAQFCRRWRDLLPLPMLEPAYAEHSSQAKPNWWQSWGQLLLTWHEPIAWGGQLFRQSSAWAEMVLAELQLQPTIQTRPESSSNWQATHTKLATLCRQLARVWLHPSILQQWLETQQQTKVAASVSAPENGIDTENTWDKLAKNRLQELLWHECPVSLRPVQERVWISMVNVWFEPVS